MKGMVVAPQPLAAEEGVIVLGKGGNAVDAAVTAALVQGIVDPLNCGIGGFGSMHIFLEEGGENVILDFTSKAGAKARPDMWVNEILGPARDGVGFLLRNDVNELGYQSIGIPGTIIGLYDSLTRYGTWSWQKALEPAISYARNGYRIPLEQASEWRVKYPEGRPDALARLTHTRAAATIYSEKGELLEAGDLLVNSELARTMEELATHGPESFYQGPIASRIIEDMERNSGLITGKDLADFGSSVKTPVQGSYRGYTVASAPPPWGAVVLIEILNILEEYDLCKLGFNSPEYIHIVSQAMKASFADRNRHLGDPAFVDVPVEQLIAKEHGRRWKDRIDSGAEFDVGFDRSREGSNTTHLSIVDQAGNCVSLTHTLGYGSGVVTPGLGFMYNNFMVAFDPLPGGPNSIAPGKMRTTGGSPTIVFKDGAPFLVLGAPGGIRIISAVLQTILNVIDHGMTILEAVSAPRIDCQGEIIDVEGRIPRWTCETLMARGHHVVRDLASYGVNPTTAARVHAILIDEVHGSLSGGADPRGYGVALTT